MPARPPSSPLRLCSTCSSRTPLHTSSAALSTAAPSPRGTRLPSPAAPRAPGFATPPPPPALPPTPPTGLAADAATARPPADRLRDPGASAPRAAAEEPLAATERAAPPRAAAAAGADLIHTTGQSVK
jgi:hypothetical protein